MELLETIIDLPIGKTVCVPSQSCLGDDVHPELPLIGAVGVRSDSLRSTGVTLVVMAVVLRDFRWLGIWDLFYESGADARRLVKLLSALGTTITGNLKLLIWVRCVSPLRLMSGLSTGGSTVRAWLVVVLVFS